MRWRERRVGATVALELRTGITADGGANTDARGPRDNHAFGCGCGCDIDILNLCHKAREGAKNNELLCKNFLLFIIIPGSVHIVYIFLRVKHKYKLEIIQLKDNKKVNKKK